MLLNNEWINNKIKAEIQKFMETSENKHNGPKLMRHREGSPEREVYANTGLCKKEKNISDKQSNSTCKRTGGTTTNKAHSEYKEGNNQDQNRIK